MESASLSYNWNQRQCAHNNNRLTRGHIPNIGSNKSDARATNSRIILILKLWGCRFLGKYQVMLKKVEKEEDKLLLKKIFTSIPPYCLKLWFWVNSNLLSTTTRASPVEGRLDDGRLSKQMKSQVQATTILWALQPPSQLQEGRKDPLSSPTAGD